VEVIVFPRTYEQSHFLLKRDAVVVVKGKLDVSEQQVKVLAERIMTLDEAEEVEAVPLHGSAGATNGAGTDGGGSDAGEIQAALRSMGDTPDPRPLHLKVDTSRVGEAGLTRLRELLGQRRGDQPVYLHLLSDGREVVLDARDVRVAATPELQAELEAMLGPGSVWRAGG
jgi:DNA polymerase III alpha subunit